MFWRTKSHKDAYTFLLSVRHALLALQSFLPPSPSSTPASLQATLLEPTVQHALVQYYSFFRNEIKERRIGREGVEGAAKTVAALRHFLAILRVRLSQKDELLVVGERGKGGKEKFRRRVKWMEKSR